MVLREREKLYTAEEFDQFITLPENEDRLFEFIDGEIIEVSPGRTRNSEYGHILSSAVRLFCRQYNLPCHTSGEAGAYRILGQTAAPDFAYKHTSMSDEYPDPDPPLWVIEVISPTDKAPAIRKKRQLYQRAGILVWELYPQVPEIDVYAPGQPMRTFGIDDVLDVGDIIPGFSIAVKDIFAV